MKITLKESTSFHKDLTVEIPELDIHQDTDTYYLALDSGVLPEEESKGKVKIVLSNLINDWIDAVEGLQDGNIAFLPYDFSDEYTGALKVKREGYHLLIRRSWVRSYGGMYPSFMNRADFKDEEFNVYIGSMKLPVEEFLFELRRERDKIQI